MIAQLLLQKCNVILASGMHSLRNTEHQSAILHRASINASYITLMLMNVFNYAHKVYADARQNVGELPDALRDAATQGGVLVVRSVFSKNEQHKCVRVACGSHGMGGTGRSHLRL
jgi:hypothetical protein